jgi:hypothetical protein
MGIEEEKVQAKDIDNVLNKIIAENFPNLEKKEHHPDTGDFHL